jgi:hypothetical protein
MSSVPQKAVFPAKEMGKRATRLVSLPESESVSRAIGLLLLSRIQAATCRARLRAASRIELHKWHSAQESAASVVTACTAHPSCPSWRTHQRPSVRVVGFPQARRLSAPRSSVPLTHGPSVPLAHGPSSVPSRRGQFCAIRVSSQLLTGYQTP